MLKLEINENEINILSNYFYTTLLDDSISIASDWQPSSQAQKNGEQLYQVKYTCQSCHLIKGQGRNLGPYLDRVSDRLQPAWMLRWILDPHKYKPDTIEPKREMSESEALDIVAYMMTL